MGNTISRLVLTQVLLLSASPVGAQIVAPAGRTLFADGVLVRSVARYDAFEEGVDGTDLERWRNIWALVWGARPHLSVSFVAPLVRLDSTSAAGLTTTSGTGDASVLVRYDAYRRNVRAGYTRVSPELGLELPTGSVASSRSAEPIAGLVVSHVRDPDWVVGDVQWTGGGRGAGDLSLGDRWRVDLAYLRRVMPRDSVGIPQILLVAELNYEKVERSRRGGAVVAGSGGRVLFFSPGVEWIVSRRVVLELSVPIAVDAGANGPRPEPEASLLLGARWLF